MSATRGPAPAGGDVRRDPVHRLKAGLFRTLGHPERVGLVAVLGTGELTVGELQGAPELDSSGVSQHLAMFRRQGLLESRKVGTTVRCRVKESRARLLLTIAHELLMADLEDSRGLLGELDAETPHRRRRAERRRP